MTRAPAELLLVSKKDVEELSALMAQVDSVELKLTVPYGERRSTLHALEAELLYAELHHVYYFDTPDLALYQGGVIVRGRDRPGDSVVKLRPIDPATLESSLRAAKRSAWRSTPCVVGTCARLPTGAALHRRTSGTWSSAGAPSLTFSHRNNARSCTIMRRDGSLPTT